jgi:hypothetical protein
MDNKSLLELCVKITGTFENGVPTYYAVTGNFDGQGISVGVLQWCAGQGSLQTLLSKIAEKMTWDTMQTYFHSDIHHFAMLKPAEAVQWCIDHYIAEGSTNIDPAAKTCWQNMLQQQASIDAQIEYATNTVLNRAQVLVNTFCPDTPNSTRATAFFFDLVTQSGGMQNQRGKVDPLPSGATPDLTEALAFAQTQNLKVAGMWEVTTQSDPFAARLLYYAYERSKLSNPQYIWDAFSRRGAIACRTGIVHGAPVNFTQLLD